MTGDSTRQALLAMLEPALAESGYDVEGVEVSSAGRRSVVRVLVDSEVGVTLDDIAAATRLVSNLLDDSDVLGEAPYTLEVTSPGIDRPLRLPRHWRRNVGRLVRVSSNEAAPVTGRIRSADEDHAVLDVDGSEQEIRYADVAKARVEVEFNRPAEQGAARRGKE